MNTYIVQVSNERTVDGKWGVCKDGLARDPKAKDLGVTVFFFFFFFSFRLK